MAKLSHSCSLVPTDYINQSIQLNPACGNQFMINQAAATLVALYASIISGMQVSEHWVTRFCTWHPELKAKWTTGLEQCHAQSLNHAAVVGFYNHLEHLQERYDIPDENICNIDEKGIQLRIGKRVYALVNYDQKTVHQVEDGNHELVMIIECVCPDGTAICPSMVFEGAYWNLEWGWDNPCNVLPNNENLC